MAATKTATTEVPAIAQKISEQLLATIKQSQQLSVDATQSWVKAVSVLPVPELPVVPGVPALPSVEAATLFSFDLAAELLSAQRDYALSLAKVLVPAKS